MPLSPLVVAPRKPTIPFVADPPSLTRLLLLTLLLLSKDVLEKVRKDQKLRVDLALYGLHDSLDDEHSFQAMWYHPYCERGTNVDFSHLFLPSWRGKCCLEEPIRPHV